GEESERLLEALVKIDARCPAQHTLRLVDADSGALLLPGTRRRRLQGNIGAGAPLQRRGEVNHRRLDPGAYVEPSRVELRRRGQPSRGRRQVGPGNVFHEHVVARLRSIAEYRQWLTR